eukprot:1788740-Rhodomonas_salina.3
MAWHCPFVCVLTSTACGLDVGQELSSTRVAARFPSAAHDGLQRVRGHRGRATQFRTPRHHRLVQDGRGLACGFLLLAAGTCVYNKVRTGLWPRFANASKADNHLLPISALLCVLA